MVLQLNKISIVKGTRLDVNIYHLSHDVLNCLNFGEKSRKLEITINRFRRYCGTAA